MLKSYKFKLKPNKSQQLILNQWLGTCRFVYNLCLGYKKDLYSCYGKNVSRNDMQKELSVLRKEYNWIGQVHSQTIQDVTDRLDKTYKAFFKGGGFPKFAKKDKYFSFSFKQGVRICENTNKIKLPFIGKISFRKTREFPSFIKYATIKKEHNGWYICLICDVPLEPLPLNKNEIGIDLGIKDFLTTSEGNKIANPKHLYKYEKELKKKQQSLARKKKGSNNRKKDVASLQNVYAKIRNTRKDFLHKTSTKIINENQVIIVENLKVKKMLQDHDLAKAISDAGWRTFVDMLEYKSKFHGRDFVKVPAYNTSKMCSNCNAINEELTLAIRYWKCEECGSEHDRDINAAINIKQKGQTILKKQEVGQTFYICGGSEMNDMESVTNPAQESHVF